MKKSPLTDGKPKLLRPSIHFKKYSHDYKITTTNFLSNYITGQTLRLDKNTDRLWQLFNNCTAGLNFSSLRPPLPKELKHLIEKGALVYDTPSQEKRDLLNMYPFVRPGLLYWKNKSGTVTVCFSRSQKYFTSIEKTRFIELNITESALLLNSNGKTKLHAILKKLRQPLTPAPTGRLFKQKYQFLRLSYKPYKHDQYEGIKLPANLRHKKDVFPNIKSGHMDLRTYHSSKIKNAFKQFNNIEITVSHAFREPSEAFNGHSYGGAFYNSVTKLFRGGPFSKVLEVGGGTGTFARQFLAKNPNHGFDYTILDISPVLLKSQARLNSEHKGRCSFLTRNATTYVKPNTYDLIISNEAIADFKTALLHKKDLLGKGASTATKESLQAIKKYSLNLSDAPETFYFNLGAIHFLENIYKNLVRGGMAFVSEYGSLNGYPQPTYHLDHFEYSIQWNNLLQVASLLGFRLIELKDLDSFLGFNYYAKAFAGNTSVLLSTMRKFGHKLQPRVYFKNELRSLKSDILKSHNVLLRGDTYLNLLEHRYWGPPINRFKVLVLVK